MVDVASLQYVVKYILSPAELRRLSSRLGQSSESIKEDEDCSCTPAIRQHLRLFLKVWAASQAINLLARLRSSPTTIDAKRVGAAIALISATYRSTYHLLNRGAFVNSKSWLSLVAPATAGVLTSLAFSLLPNVNVRGYIALYLVTKAAEWAYNWLDDLGYVDWKPRIFGSWLLFPLAMGQLFYTLVNAPECTPNMFKRLMLRFSGQYGVSKPSGYPQNYPWPSDDQWLRSFADVASLGFPRFRSPVVYTVTEPTPVILAPVEPILSGSNPANTTLIGALLHPSTPSDLQPFLGTVLDNFVSSGKWVLPLYLLIGGTRAFKGGKSILQSPEILAGSAANAIRTCIFVAMTTATAWSGIGLSQSLLPSKILPATRFRLIGFMSGLWSIVDSVNGRPRYLYATRLALVSQYNLLVQSRGRSLVGPDAEVAWALAMAATFVLFNKAPEAIASPLIRKICSWMQTGKWVDVASIDKAEAKEKTQ